MKLELKTLAIALAVIVCCGLCYVWGYRTAETKCALEFEQYKTAQTDANKVIQEQIRIEYEKKIETLNANFERLRDDNNKRMRQLQAYRERERNLETCSRDLDTVTELAVEGERLLKEADGFIEALQ